MQISVLRCIKQQINLIADIQTNVLSLELLSLQEEGHPASREHAFALTLSLSLHLSSVYLQMPLSLLNTAHRKVMAGHFTGHTQLHASYFCSVLCCTERRGGFQHNVAGLKVKLRITCCWKQIWTMACGRHISHAHVIVTHTCTLYSGSVCDVSPWGQ